MTENVVLVKTQGMNKQQFVDEFRKAVLETMMLLFERRGLDLGEPSTSALRMLAQVARDMEVLSIYSTLNSSTSKPATHGH